MDGLDPNSIDFGKYGFGKERTLKQYEEYAGISFKYRSVQQNTKDRIEPLPLSEVKSYDSEEEWKQSLIRSNDIHILIHKNELLFEDEIPNDYDFWYVGTHDENDQEIYRKDKTEHELTNMGKNEWADFRLIYFSNKPAKTYTVWPHSKSKGWCNKITKHVQ